jgi:hypothetical protein
MSGGLHFWSPRGPSEGELRAWDPDAEPSRYASGLGHNVLELVVRLRRIGIESTFGAEIPARTRLLVLFGWMSVPEPFRGEALEAVWRARGRFALIRSDIPLGWRFPVPPIVEFMPTQSSVVEPFQRWLPPLPQRGLIERRTDRRGSIRSLAFKGNPESVPSALRDTSWSESLAARGIDWILDTPAGTDGSDQHWHDFSLVDVALCLRDPGDRLGVTRKPATRLVNAWRAGAIPIVANEPGYRELGREGDDCFFVDEPAEALAVLDRLRAEPCRIGGVERAIASRASEFAPDLVVERWGAALLAAALDEARPVPELLRSLRVAAARASEPARRRSHTWQRRVV